MDASGHVLLELLESVQMTPGMTGERTLNRPLQPGEFFKAVDADMDDRLRGATAVIRLLVRL